MKTKKKTPAHSKMPQTYQESKDFKEMMWQKKNEISPSAPVGGEGQKTKYEERFMKIRHRFAEGGKVVDPPKPKYASAEDYYKAEGNAFLAKALSERGHLAGRKDTMDDVNNMWESVKKANPRLAAELLQRAKQLRMSSENNQYGTSTPGAGGFSYGG